MIKSKYIIVSILFLGTFLTIDIAHAQKSAPQYTVQTLTGETVNLEDLEGKAVMLNSWAIWCEPCREEMPGLEQLHKKFSNKGLQIVGVNIEANENKKQVSFFTKDMGITYQIWMDSKDTFSRTFYSIGVPHTVLINTEGKIIHEWRGQFDPLSEDTILKVNQALGLVESESLEFDNLQTIGIAAAVLAGLLSFLSPCVLPLIPAYASFITGLSLQDLSQKNNSSTASKQKIRTKALSRGSLFVLGFSIIFILLGSTVAFLGSLFFEASAWIERIGGIILIFFGIHLIGILRIPWLERQLKFDISKQTSRKASSFFVGMAFGAGWTPCIGPILAGILAIAATSNSIGTGALLLSAYSVGLAIPFLLSALAIDRFLVFFDKIKTKIVWIERISGVLLVGIGIMLLTGSLTILSDLFSDTLTPKIIFQED